MTKNNQAKPVQENDNEKIETSVEDDELVKTCSGEPPSHAATNSTEKAFGPDSGSKTGTLVSTVAAVVVAEKACGSGEAQPSAASAAVKSRKSERIKKMKEKVEDEEEKVETFGEGWFEKSFLVGLIGSRLGMDEEALKKVWTSVPMEKKKEIEWKWKELHLEKLRCLLSKHELEYETASAMYNAAP